MRPLAYAALDLACAGAAMVAGGLALALGAGGVAGDPGAARAAGAGLAAAVLLAWGLWGAGATRRALRLALPAPRGWVPEPFAATARRAVLAQALPATVLAVAAGLAGRSRWEESGAAAAGALAGLGVAALLAAARVRRSERRRGRRVLREPGRRPPVHRRAFYLEPGPYAPGPGAPRPPAPWPSHRPPPRRQLAAIEIDPANPPARHAPGVRHPRGRRQAPGADGGRGSG